MTLGEALIETLTPPHQRAAVDIVFEGIKGAFSNVRDAFIQAIEDEALAIETEMQLLVINVFGPLEAARAGPLQYADNARCTASRVAAARNSIETRNQK